MLRLPGTVLVIVCCCSCSSSFRETGGLVGNKSEGKEESPLLVVEHLAGDRSRLIIICTQGRHARAGRLANLTGGWWDGGHGWGPAAADSAVSAYLSGRHPIPSPGNPGQFAKSSNLRGASLLRYAHSTHPLPCRLVAGDYHSSRSPACVLLARRLSPLLAVLHIDSGVAVLI